MQLRSSLQEEDFLGCCGVILLLRLLLEQSNNTNLPFGGYMISQSAERCRQVQLNIHEDGLDGLTSTSVSQRWYQRRIWIPHVDIDIDIDRKICLGGTVRFSLIIQPRCYISHEQISPKRGAFATCKAAKTPSKKDHCTIICAQCGK